MEKNKLKTIYGLNLAIFILEVFATLWMMSGVTASGNSGALSAARFRMLIYFTVDSNILMGLFALFAAIDCELVLKGKKAELSTITYILKLVGTVGVTLTMLVTMFFLTPTMAAEYGLFGCYKNSNLFLHLINPLVSIYAFLGYERTLKIKFAHSFSGIVPMVVYSAYYMTTALIHSENGVVQKGYDWYGFLVFGIKSAVIILPLLIAITYGISVALWKLNRIKTE